MAENDTVTLDCLVLYETPTAWKCRFDEKGFPVWVPKTQAKVEPKDEGGNVFECTMPEWLAINENLI